MTADEQARERIRTALDESLIVEAAAGTGKTTELIQRIVNVLRAGKTTVDRMVAVTFTRKAAGELRLRLRIELDTARTAAESSGRTVEAERLNQALAHLEEAHIGTIHAFCAELLRQRPVEARISPGFEELDEAQAERLYHRAFDKWIQTALQQMPEGVRRALSRTATAAGELPASDGGPLDRLRAAGWSLIEWRDYPGVWRRESYDRTAEIDLLLPQIAEVAGIVGACSVFNHPVRQHLRCVEDFAVRQRRSDETRPRDYDEIEGLLVHLARELRKSFFKGPARFSPAHSREEVLEARRILQDNLAQLQRRLDADLASLLQSELQGLRDEYEALKLRLGKLDFVDLLVRARSLIRGNASVRRFMQERFTHIFVDEFQDTDPVQAELLVLLSADDPGEADWTRVRPKPGKLFLVGDPKQSIYRFRRADILMYQALSRRLQSRGVGLVFLSRSFRSVLPIQEAVNAAFAPQMTEDFERGQPRYVALEDGAAAGTQPSVVVLPAPYPYGTQRLSNEAIEACLPQTVAAYVEWLLRGSNWKVRDPASGEAVPIASQHIAILFRRFMSWGRDITRDYIHALEVRNVPHLLWGARSFHHREEVETLRAALKAVEWPDDELSVYATLRGALFAIPDNLLLRFRHAAGAAHPFHPFRPVPPDMNRDFAPVTEALDILAGLHRRRNRRSITETIHALLTATRAHAAFALRPSGNQVLANVYRICDLARTWELGDGYSFRGFVERLSAQAERDDNAESPVLEEAAEGVRLMTVHNAKGLEFPVVILADLTANIATRTPEKYVDSANALCASRIFGCAPWELTDHEAEEHERDVAEGIRVAYVAATRARDLLVVTAVGDAQREGWLHPLARSVYPPKARFRAAQPPPNCPPFGEASVLFRPTDYDGASESSVKPGLHLPESGSHTVVWWDPAILRLSVHANFGLRQEEILMEDAKKSTESTDAYDAWRGRRDRAIAKGSAASLNVFLATDALEPPFGFAHRVRTERIPRPDGRPRGRRFGSLVHVVFRDAPFDADRPRIDTIARSHGRLLSATDDEVRSAADAVAAALNHPLFRSARLSPQCHRELPLGIRMDPDDYLEAVVDLAFVEHDRWVVIDFKTDTADSQQVVKYQRQVGWYVYALEQLTGRPGDGWLLQV